VVTALATVFNVVFGLFAAYVSRVTPSGDASLNRSRSLCHRNPTAVAGVALLLLWGPYGSSVVIKAPRIDVMFTAKAIILANISLPFPGIWRNKTRSIQ